MHVRTFPRLGHLEAKRRWQQIGLTKGMSGKVMERGKKERKGKTEPEGQTKWKRERNAE